MNKFTDLLLDFFYKIISREFLVFIVATILFIRGTLPSDLWWYCALAFISARTLQKFKELEIRKIDA